jgi:hypothetical protein
VTQGDLHSACRLLFGPQARLDLDFLAGLDLAVVRRRFRKCAMEIHPDRAATLGRSPAALAESFKHVQAAYRTLTEHLKSGRRIDPPGPNVEPPPRSEWPSPRPAPATAQPQARPRPETAARPPDHFWHSGLPLRPLRFGEYLYYAGRISWMQLIRALVWQAGQRPRFGQMAAQFGYLTPDSILQVLSHRRPTEKIGEAALRMRLLSALEHQVVLLAQSHGRRRIGDYFIENATLRASEMEDLGRAFRQHNARNLARTQPAL